MFKKTAVLVSKPNSVVFLFIQLDEWGSLQKKGGTRDEMFARILDGVARIKERQDQLRRTIRVLRTRVAKCTEVDSGIFENLL
jgi:hypothetical protein